jgi:predicted nucleotidyltransferase component of viral defense system
MSKASEHSVKERLKNISKRDGVAFNLLMESFFLERFLVRIAKSQYRDHFIFKGGMCLDQYLDLGRETRDLDFLLQKIDSNLEVVSGVIGEIIHIEHDDSIEFTDLSVDTLSNEHKKYPGYRLGFIGKLGQIRQKISIDFGVGDVVRPRLLDIELMRDKKPLYEERIELLSYPPEFIFAEKLEAIIHLDDLNGRMKDYHDCIQIIRDSSISKDEFKRAILETFSNRETPFCFIPNHEEKLGQRWNSFTQKNKAEQTQLSQIIFEINDFLKSIGL